jgi:hypothetical protein
MNDSYLVMTGHCSWLMMPAATHNGLTDLLKPCEVAVPEQNLLPD